MATLRDTPFPRLLRCLLVPLVLLASAAAQIPIPNVPKLPPLRPKAPAAAPAGAHPFAGVFASADLTLELQWDAADKVYTGCANYEGERMPCQGAERNGVLVGTYTSEGERFAFKLEAKGAIFVLTADGEQHELTRRGDTGKQPTAQAPAEGGVGIVFQQDEQGRFVVAQLAPGGPAETGKVPLGAVLLAVDETPVAGLSMEQLRALIVGTVGSQVTLTIGTVGGRVGIVLQRAPLGGQTRAHGLPSAPGGAPPALPEVPDAGAYPAWLVPGSRVTFYGGSATLPGVRRQLVEHTEGGWVDDQGRRYREEDVVGAGGAGFSQYDFVSVTPQRLGVNLTMFLLAGAQLESVVRTATQGLTGDANGLADIWLPPARLRAMRDQANEAVLVRHLSYPLGGRTYEAVTVHTKTQTGFTRYAYDLDSGLLLAFSSSSTGTPVVTPLGDEATTGSGSTMIVTLQLRNVRQVNLPWTGQPPPQWLQAGHTFRLAGGYTNSLTEGSLPPWRFDALITVEQRVGDCLVGKLKTRLDFGNGMSQDAETAQVYGPASFANLYLNATSLRQLQPGQLLDQDPVTGWRLQFVGSDGRSATILEQGPLDQQSYTYDVQSGALVGTSVRQQQGPAIISMALQVN